MERYVKLYQVMTKVGGYPQVHLTQLSSNEFKIEMGGELMKSFMRLGEIQEEIKTATQDDFELKTIYGDGQDAVFRFIEKGGN